jgi:hypothetical protein
MADNKKDFNVSDRRRFGIEGERRTDVRTEEEEKPATPAATAPATPAATAPAPPPATPAPPASQQQQAPEAAPPEAEKEEFPAPPSPEEQSAQNEAYRASGKKLDEIVGARMGSQQAYPEMSFEKVIESFYMSALIQMGALRTEGEPARVDIIGARQTIDSLTILQEKTKGNLSDREQTMLQNVLFELRMAWIELTNAIAKGATEQPAAGGGPMIPPGPK